MTKRMAAASMVVMLLLTASLGWIAASGTRLDPPMLGLPLEPILSDCGGWRTTTPDGSVTCVGLPNVSP